jgi:cobalt-precorrin-5B (C1)-methyltransferase
MRQKADGMRALRRGWTTGACAAAATRADYEALTTGSCPDPVEIRLPSGAWTAFAIVTFETGEGAIIAWVVKDAGDDPDVTHGTLLKATVGSGLPGGSVPRRRRRWHGDQARSSDSAGRTGHQSRPAGDNALSRQ